MFEWIKRTLGSRRLSAEAFAAHDTANWQAAVPLLERLAAERPEDAGVAYRLGDAFYQLGRSGEALPLLERAAAANGRDPECHYKLGNALKELGRGAEALDRYRRVLELDPKHARALNNAGAILEEQGRTEEALQHYRLAVAADRSLEPAHGNLAQLLHRSNRFTEAAEAYHALLEVAPRSDEAWCNLGNVYVGLERVDEAIRCYRRAIECAPGSPLGHYRLGVALLECGKHAEAEAAARRALELAPNHIEGWVNLGDVLQAQNRFDEALAAYERGRALAPNSPDLLNNIGVAHKYRRDLQTAMAFYEKAIAADPHYLLARINHAGTLLEFGDVEKAAAAYREILEADPKHEQAARQLLLCQLYRSAGADEFFAEHLAFGRRFGSGKQNAPLPRPVRQDGKLRIGYVSSDLRRHPVAYNIMPLVEFRDRGAVEIYLYAHVRRPDDMTRWFRGHADAWRSITHLSDAAAAQKIREDRIDILVVLAGRFDENRPLIALHRPAPVMVSMHDPATSGLSEMDYLIADRGLAPRRTAEKFTERVACLPTFYLHPPLDSDFRAAEPPSATQGRITFGSFNNPAKIGPDVVALWARVLLAVPGSRLRMKHFDTFMIPSVRARYVDLFRRHGVEESRLLLHDQQLEDRKQHLARYADIDIALDSFPFTGSTTTFESLSMGVPVVTLEGSRMIARWSLAMLRKVGLPHLVAKTGEDYVEIAKRLAADPAELARLRRDLPERVLRSPLCDGRRRARQMERLLQRMWAIHRAGKGKRSTIRW